MKILQAILCFLLLTACSPVVTQIEYVKQEIPVSPSYPEYYQVLWDYKEGLYCTNDVGAKNLLKNFELLKSTDEEMRKILESLRK